MHDDDNNKINIAVHWVIANRARLGEATQVDKKLRKNISSIISSASSQVLDRLENLISLPLDDDSRLSQTSIIHGL